VDAAFLIVVGINLCFLSGLIIYRMRTLGATVRRTAGPVIELWVAFALWIGVFRALSARIGAPGSEGAVGELGQLGHRLLDLPTFTRGWVLGGVGIAMGLLVHLLWTLSRVMRGGAGG
jgi:hypothetical protein